MFKKTKEERKLTRIEKRVNSMSTPELLTWVDQVLYSTGRNISSWQKSQDKYSLEEANTGAEALLAITKCLNERMPK
jgi:hypothetical protein